MIGAYMIYKKIKEGRFLDRPNRFIANIEIDGKIEKCHVKNTGRCKELFQPGVQVYLEDCEGKERKTRYDVIAVEKHGTIINVDSQIPNKVVAQWLKEGNLFSEKAEIKTEKTYGNSRFDIYVEDGNRKAFIEVKGVTLENNGVASFPDAPTERGLKHVHELCKCIEDGYEAYVFFLIQMKGIHRMEPNWKTHEAFGQALLYAQRCGVKILVYDSKVTSDSIVVDQPVPIVLETNQENHLFKIVEPLLQWYEENKRILPWRASKNPYYIWISEIMLQQTRVEAVKPFFERFIKAFPTVEDVANAKEEQLLKMWEGLGYYNRVRNIQKASQIIAEQYNGELPADYEKLRQLPGIGNYTAGAVSSIAYGISVPAVDGNVLRVISRIDERFEDIMKQSTKTKVEEDLFEIMPKDKAGEFNQSLMELGATVCLPNGAPLCEECPVKEICLAYKNHTIDKLPVKAPKKKRRIEEKTVLIIQDGSHVALGKRGDKGLLAGMYELPNLEGHKSEEEVLEYIKSLDLEAMQIKPLDKAKHIFSHVEWRMIGYVVRVAALDQKKQKDLLFVDQKESEENYAVPAAFRAYTKYMKIRIGQKKFQ